MVSSAEVQVGDWFGELYRELRQLASSYVRREGPAQTLLTTALVHEAYLKLAGQNSPGWRDRSGFFSAAATAMRRILVDHARHRKALKRGGDQTPTGLDETVALLESRGRDLVELDRALSKLAQFDPRKAAVVEVRFFIGLSVEETAEVLSMSPRTAAREWNLARSWLLAELSDLRDDSASPKMASVDPLLRG